MSKQADLNKLAYAYQVIVEHLAGNTEMKDNHANFEGTAKRAAKALMEMCLSDKEIAKVVSTTLSKAFPIDRAGNHHAGMITQGPIAVNSMCPHHLLPVRYHAFVSYVPEAEGKVLGLSKLTRIAQVLGKRPVLQEKLAADICDVLCEGPDKHPQFKQIKSQGSACVLIGVHNCMTCRGVAGGAKTATSEMRGVYGQSNLESKFYQAIDHLKTTFPYEG